MAENDDGQEKTEEPSQRRLDKAKEDGDILTSKEAFVFTTTLMLLGLIPLLQMFGVPILKEINSFFKFSNVDNGLLIKNFSVSFLTFVKISAFVGLPIGIMILLTQFAIGGAINFSSKNIKFDGNKINPLQGLKRIFSIKGLVELAKSLIKVIFLGGLTALVVYFSLPQILALLGSNLAQNFKVLATVFYLLICFLLLVLGLIAVIDFLYARHARLQKLRMSRQDLKDESKQTEGSPEVKSKIRRLQMEAAQRSREHANSLDGVREATAIITNPTHFAVALKFVPGSMAVPVIVSMGRGRLAEKIIEKGGDNQITVFSSPLLARALYFTSRVGAEIDSRLYGAVAAVLAYVIHTEQGHAMQQPAIDVPKDLRFNEFGRPVNDE